MCYAKEPDEFKKPEEVTMEEFLEKMIGSDMDQETSDGRGDDEEESEDEKES